MSDDAENHMLALLEEIRAKQSVMAGKLDQLLERMIAVERHLAGFGQLSFRQDELVVELPQTPQLPQR